MESMLNYYSIVIHPQDSIIELFKTYKGILFNKIGSFGSRNSIAHITILEFAATDEELKFVIEKLIKITQKETCFDALFDTVMCSSSSKAIFVLPDKAGNEHFKKLLKNIRQKIRGKKNTSNAHLTIGRRLSPKQLENSNELITNVNFHFHCNQIALRKFNDTTEQYDIIRIFPLLEKSNYNLEQQASFDFDI
ncbi:2'-5' RNA ligase family protein [Chryseobacterium formosus]|uniref:2'-5' RNA ligase family protein n=1 Tax=Chryseobacterium formosus TaxID=1537363 RepID=A0ABT3XQ54_9FLAO|nr:2'-5' RNA ligase family protein [Chryseobacterium formosus]MCX8524225.1 2'-5' RNA ligase family protein [Chryseobacterium formosus]